MKLKKFLKSETRPMWLKLTILVGPVVVVFMFTGIIGVGRWYNESLRPLSVVATDNIEVVIEEGSSARDIGKLLQDEKIIRNATAFTWYVDREGLRQSLQAGAYQLNPAYSVQEIVTILVEGKINTTLVTIIPGERLDQIQQSLVKLGFDELEVEEAINKSYDHPIFDGKPGDASLEGYIFPETYQTTSASTIESLFTRTFDEFYAELTPEIRQGIEDQGLTLFEGITLASIIEQEVVSNKDRAIVAQVFLKRLALGEVLGADATFFYAAEVDGNTPTVDYDSPYNTRINAGLPPGPIGNFKINALEAVAFPADTDYLYFVSGDDGNTYFANTQAEHEANTRKHCIELCRLP